MDRRWLVGGAVAVVAVLAGIWFGRGVQTTPPAIPAPAFEDGASVIERARALVVHGRL